MNGALVNSGAETADMWFMLHMLQYLTIYGHTENGMQIISWYF